MYKDLPENGRKFYEEYNAEIQRIVPKESLLVMNVKEGWGSLCAFLVEEDRPFTCMAKFGIHVGWQRKRSCRLF
jgi:hypothetical protein